MKKGLTTAICVLLGAISTSVLASEEGLYLLYGDEDIVSIATGTSQPVTKAPSTATIITAEDIRAMGAITLDEVLESVPGLHVIPSTLDRMNPVYTIRGIYTGQNPQVLFLLNGTRLTPSTFTGGLSSTSRMNVENISRIEVIRGPGSAVYGADAYAGVINIVTKSAEELGGLHAGVRGGSFDTRNTWINYGGNLNKDWDFVLNLEYATQNADESRVVSSDLQSVFDATFGTSASLTPSYLDQRYESLTYNLHASSNRWKFALDGWSIRDRGVGAGSSQALDHEGHDDFDHYIASLQYRNRDIAEDWEIELNLSHQVADLNARLNIFPPGAVLPIGLDGNINPVSPAGLVEFPDGMIGSPGGKGTVFQADLIALYEGFNKHSIRINVGGKTETIDAEESKNFGPGVIDGTSLPVSGTVVDGTLTSVTGTPFVFLPDKSRDITYLSLQDVWDIYPDWILTTGIRYDHYSDFGGTTNPRIALVWNTSLHLTTKLLYGRAFRAPSFSELHTQNNPVVQGNPNLGPETIDTLELAFAYQPTDKLNTGLSLYTYRTRDMIDFESNGIAQNSKSLDGMGFEIEADWKANDRLNIISNFAYQQTQKRPTDIQEPIIPVRQFYLDARWEFMDNWRLSSQLNWISDRDRVNSLSASGLRENVDGYTWVNLNLRREQIMGNWEMAASIKNLFDEDAVEPSDGRIPDNYPLHERAYYIELRYKQ